MSHFVATPICFSANCVRTNGQCMIVRENILFLDDGNEHAAIAHLQMNCEHVVIVPDTSDKEQALLYHTSCQLMTDVVNQIFQDYLEAPVSLPQHFSEMTVGELHHRCVAISYDDCKVKVEGFSF